MNYEQTLEYMYSQLPMFQRVGAAAYKPNLNNTIELCTLNEEPHTKFKSIHIAGTNGKGSTSHLLASVFQEAGYKTGLFTSPHLKDFRERIKINGKMISKDFVCDFIQSNVTSSQQIKPSFFELTAVLAFSWFADQKVDIAIIETGLGGRLDSTNVIAPELSIITNISFDHQNLLGNTLAEIAFEKAGIIKKDTPVIIGEKNNETDFVFQQKSTVENAKILFATDIFSTKKIGIENNYLIVNVLKNNELIYPNIKSSLIGNYQLKNINTLVASISLINEKNIAELNEKSIYEGIKNVVKNTGLMGRWQILNNEPLIVCDTGHNEKGISEVLEMIGETKYKNLHIVFGMVNDKDIEKVLSMLPMTAQYYFCKASIPRAMDESILQEKALAFNLIGFAFPDVQTALKNAKNNAQLEDMIFIGGSTFVVADAI